MHLPSVQVYASKALHSLFEVGLDMGKMIGFGVLAELLGTWNPATGT